VLSDGPNLCPSFSTYFHVGEIQCGAVGGNWLPMGYFCYSEHRQITDEDDQVSASATEFVLLLVHALIIVRTQKLPLRYMVTTHMQ
jgi:hypothetical protein